MQPTKRPRTSKIQTLQRSLQQGVQQLQCSNITLAQLSQETDSFLTLVQDFRSARAQRQLLVRKIEVGLAQACGELQACEQEQGRCSLRERLRLVQELVKGQCLPVVKSEQLSESEEPTVRPKVSTSLSFLSPTAPN